MTTKFGSLAVMTLLLAGAAPVLAQTPPPPPPGAGADAMPMRDGGGRDGRWRHGGRHGMFASMSEAGRATMRATMKNADDRREDREKVRAARDRMLAVLDADRLDGAALRRAMDEERLAANASRERRQSAMLAGFAKLSVADRKAFVADARSMRTRVESRMKQFRERRGGPPEGGPSPLM